MNQGVEQNTFQSLDGMGENTKFIGVLHLKNKERKVNHPHQKKKQSRKEKRVKNF